MKNNLLLVIAFALTIPLFAGCYTQIGSMKDDKYSDEYVKDSDDSIAEETVDADSSTAGTDYYFDENGYPRDRYFFDSYYPASIYLGALWYNPWYSSWGWYGGGYWGFPYPYPYAYAGWWSPGYCYSPGYYSYNPPVLYGGHGATRTVGNTRGGIGGTRSRGESTTGGSGTVLDLPTGSRSGGSAGHVKETSATPRASTARTGRAAVDNGPRSGSNSNGSTRGTATRSGGNVRQPRRPSSPPGNTGSQPSVGSTKPAERSAPAAAPSGNQGNTRGGNTGSTNSGTRGGGRR